MIKKIPETVEEIHYPQKIIEVMTPYLNDIIENINHVEKRKAKPQYLTLKHRALAWYFCFNNHNKTDAYLRAYFGRYNRVTKKIEILNNNIGNRKSVPVTASEIMKRAYMQEACVRINKVIEAELKSNLTTDLLQQLIIQATYDPSMFIENDGSPKFQSWDEIPPEYRCCVEGIETKAYGRNADYIKTTLKLVDREKARKYLVQMCPSLVEPVAHKHLITTLDEDGKEKGIDFSKMSTDELREMEKTLTDELIREGVKLK